MNLSSAVEDRTSSDVQREWPYRPLDHPNQNCGERQTCWRQACRDHFGPYRTIERLASGLTVAHCHSTAYPPDCLDLRADIWRHRGTAG